MEKKPEGKVRKSFRQAMRELDMQEYIFLDQPRIELSGNDGVLIEHHHGMIEYTEECIKIAAKNMTIKITGMNLELRAMNKTELSIGGMIAAVELLS